MTNGFAFSPQSMMHLVPTSIKESIVDYEGNSIFDRMSDLIDTTVMFDGDTFINQFVRNNLSNKQLVPQVNSLDTKLFLENGVIKEITEIIKPNRISNSDLYKDKTSKSKAPYLKYININLNNKDYYFSVEIVGDGVRYNKINPLGITNYFVEYTQGQDIESIFNQEQIAAAIPNETDINNQSIPEASNEYYDNADPTLYQAEITEEIGFPVTVSTSQFKNVTQEQIEQAKKKCE